MASAALGDMHAAAASGFFAFHCCSFPVKSRRCCHATIIRQRALQAWATPLLAQRLVLLLLA